MRRERPGRASDGICKKEKETAHLSEGARFLYGAGETGGGRWAGDTEGNVGRLPRPAWGRCPQTPAIFRFAEKGKPWTRALGEVAPKVTERVKRFYANILICHSENPGKILCSAQDDEEGRLKRFVIPSQTAPPPAPPGNCIIAIVDCSLQFPTFRAPSPRTAGGALQSQRGSLLKCVVLQSA